MKWFSRLAALAMVILALPSWAKVVEQQLTLPDGLGSAVLYSNDQLKKPGPGVVVIHEWWGLNAYAKGRAKALAKLGYTSIAVDMYGTGKVADHPKDAQAFMEAAMREPDKMNARFDAAMAILKAQPNVDGARIYAIGYCFGGGVVLNQARMGKALAGVASFHGSLGSSIQAEKGKLKAKLLVATGGADPFNPPQVVSAFVKEMMDAGADLDLRVYPGAMHSFTNPGSTALGKQFDMPLAYDEAADKDSWAALLRMLKGR
ncbi:dienelactone hydrolase family protein [Gallaecimonas kandeliae]|uniref:dienelactone hydrolase family protein n=1 Tax=Gallaecimonas kandeliae TaxID=3029055 RepID=UPI002647A1FD|nr:dienelactone hydrolase family protein [Gallaecimonas kandeliae]WKE66566.1 dienelactone hydrolase family protein [Gallaecimonas kandeliae]